MRRGEGSRATNGLIWVIINTIFIILVTMVLYKRRQYQPCRARSPGLQAAIWCTVMYVTHRQFHTT